MWPVLSFSHDKSSVDRFWYLGQVEVPPAVSPLPPPWSPRPRAPRRPLSSFGLLAASLSVSSQPRLGHVALTHKINPLSVGLSEMRIVLTPG